MMIEITEEITRYLGEKLFDQFSTPAEAMSVEFLIATTRYAFNEAEYKNWLTSPSGIHAIKQAMVEREYNYHIHSNRYVNTHYECAFFDALNRRSVKSLLESTAVLLAAYHALKMTEAGY